MEQPQDPEPAESGDELAQMSAVDQHPKAHRAGDGDEGQVLAELYGVADASGYYTGEVE